MELTETNNKMDANDLASFQQGEPEPVLISVSVVVSAPSSCELPEGSALDAIREDFLDRLATRLQTSIADTATEPWCEDSCGVSFAYLEDEGNAGKCVDCARWSSDYTAPGYLPQLKPGRLVDGAMLCNEYFHVGIGQNSAGETH
jgi:hypothetical protein